MKRKKSFLIFGIIALVLFLGVGYAVVSSVYLNIGGTASVNDQDLNVEITNAVASTNISNKTLDFTHVLSNKNLTSNFTLNEMVLNEVVTITYTVTNNETDVDAELSLASGVELSNTNSDYFDVDYEITDNETDLENNDKTMEVVVTVGLIKTPVTEENSSTTVGLTLSASPKGGNSSSGGGTEVEATEIYYNQPYNALVSNETVASDTATYARNGQAYNVTNLYNNMSELQVKARNLADAKDKIIKTLVVYEDFTIEIFVDGLLSVTYPSSSVAIEGQTLNVTDGFEAQISSDFKTITIGEEVYELNTFSSSLKVGPEHLYFMGYPEDTPGQLMAMGVVFKSDNKLDVYINGNLFGESSTEYYMVGNSIYLGNEGENPVLYGYVSLDGTQFISKGYGVYTYQGIDKLYYGRAYSTFGNFDEDSERDRVSFIPYRDGSFDVILDWMLVGTMPVGSITYNGNNVSFNLSGEIYEFVIGEDLYSLYALENGIKVGYGMILDDIWASDNVFNTTFNYLVDEEVQYIIKFGQNSNYTIGESDVYGDIIISEKAIIIEHYPLVLIYDEKNNYYKGNFYIDGTGYVDAKLVPVQ